MSCVEIGRAATWQRGLSSINTCQSPTASSHSISKDLPKATGNLQCRTNSILRRASTALLHSSSNGASRHLGSTVRPHLTSMADRLKASMVLHRHSSSGVSNLLSRTNMPLLRVPRQVSTAHHHPVSMAHHLPKDSTEHRHRDSTGRHRNNNNMVRRRQASTRPLHPSSSTALRHSRLSDTGLSRRPTLTFRRMLRLSARR